MNTQGASRRCPEDAAITRQGAASPSPRVGCACVFLCVNAPASMCMRATALVRKCMRVCVSARGVCAFRTCEDCTRNASRDSHTSHRSKLADHGCRCMHARSLNKRHTHCRSLVVSGTLRHYNRCRRCRRYESCHWPWGDVAFGVRGGRSGSFRTWAACGCERM